ncbi:MAG: hypothetical protein ACOCV1_00165 [Bacillota bacterium]
MVNKAVKLTSIIGGICLFVYLLILSIVKVNIEDLKLGWFIILISIGFFIYGFIILVTWFINKDTKETLKGDEKLPKPITVEEAEKYARDLIKNPTYADYLDSPDYNGVKELGQKTKSLIYILYAKGKYEVNKRYCVLINMHYPFEKHKIIINPNKYEISKEAQLLADFPESEPDFEETITENPLLGTKQVTRKTLKKDNKDEKKKKEEDL